MPKVMYFILHSDGEEPARDLLLSALLYQEKLHNQIWIYDSGHWSKNKKLWSDVQNSSWDDVVMKDNCKEVLKKDIYGFFDMEELYKKLSIPWKVRRPTALIVDRVVMSIPAWSDLVRPSRCVLWL